MGEPVILERILAIALAVALAAAGVQTIRVGSLKNKLESQRIEGIEKARKIEAEWAAKVFDIGYKNEQERIKRDQEYQATIDGLRSRKPTVVVRDRFSCPATPSATPGNDGAEGRGLLPEDAEFLLREAKRADELAADHAALQAYVKLLLQYLENARGR